MRRLICITLALFLCIHLLPGCHKREEKIQSVYTFTNTTGQRISLDFYGSQSDYYRNESRLVQYIVEPGASRAIPLDIARTYWLDWYSAGYSLNNWWNGNDPGASPHPALTIAAEDDHIFITTDVTDTSRSMLLDGGGISSSWYGSLGNAQSRNGSFRLVFRKDFSGEYSFTDTLGATTTSQLTYRVTSQYFSSGNPQPGFNLDVFDGGTDRFCQILAHPQGPFYASRDSMTISFSRWPSLQFFPLVRD